MLIPVSLDTSPGGSKVLFRPCQRRLEVGSPAFPCCRFGARPPGHLLRAAQTHSDQVVKVGKVDAYKSDRLERDVRQEIAGLKAAHLFDECVAVSQSGRYLVMEYLGALESATFLEVIWRLASAFQPYALQSCLSALGPTQTTGLRAVG